MSKSVVIVDGVRTPYGRIGGSLRDFAAVDLAAIAIRGLVDKTKILEKGKIDSVFAGTALGDSKASNPARYAALKAGLPYEVSASYIEMQCGSAIDCINHAAWQIASNSADVIIAGGMESYSQMPFRFPSSTPPYQVMPPLPIIPSLSPAKEDDIDMLHVSELLAKQWGVSRQECDTFAFNSQQRAGHAMAAGYFDDELIPVSVPTGRKTPPIVFDKDEHPRPDTTLEALSGLKAVLGPDCVTTAGNASGRNDGAAFVLLMNEEKAAELGYTPYARWLAGADVGVDPKVMGIGAAYATLMAIERSGLSVSDIDVFECNEAFASQNLAVVKEIEKLTGHTIDMETWNPNGGAIAFGHPNGSSGARVCIFTMKELVRKKGKYGVFSSCCGGGLGVATLIENLRR